MEGKIDNELIAEFMGYVKKPDSYLWLMPPPKENYVKDSRDFAFNSSWDCLIPVVEKMSEFGVWNLRPGFAHFENYAGEMRESHKFTFSKSTMDFETEDDSPVEWVFIVACVCLDGIKWYNRQKEK